MEVILATRNPGKMAQIRKALYGLGLKILSLDEAGIEGEAVEDGATLEENAMKKALYAWERKGNWSLAEDTGLYINALKDEPGIRAARWAGEGKRTEEIMYHTLERLRNVPHGRRTATFKTVAVLVPPEGEAKIFVGEASGYFLLSPRGGCKPGMPYSAIFVPDGQPGGDDKVFAEMTEEEINRVSHRGKAIAQVRDFFRRRSS